MKLYTTSPSILTLVTWLPQSKLAFSHSPSRLSVRPPALGQTKSYSVQPGLPLATMIGPVGRSRIFFYWNPPSILDSKALGRHLQVVLQHYCDKHFILQKKRREKNTFLFPRCVEKKDYWIHCCWEQGLLNPWLLKSISVECKICWMQDVLNASFYQLVMNTTVFESRSVEIN